MPCRRLSGRSGDAIQKLYILVSEGIQVLEHACLIRFAFHGNDRSTANYHRDCMTTRRGPAALANNTVERVLSGDGA